MADTITINELKPGDIILFSPSDEWISKLIVFLTQSKVSHTGLIDRNLAYLINEEGDGTIRKMLPDPGERTIYVRRLKNAPDTSKVVDVAMDYVIQKVPYPKSNLVFLGIYILAGDFIPDTLTGDLIKNLLRLACYELIRLVNEIHYHDADRPMVCSQFAAACYDQVALECGPEYKIRYNEKVTTVPTLLRKILDQLEEDAGKQFVVEDPEKKHLLLGAMDHCKEVEECCAQLLEKLVEGKAKEGVEKEPEGAEKELAGAEERMMVGASCGAEEQLAVGASCGAEDQLAVGAEGRRGKVSDEMIVAIYQYAKLVLKMFGVKTVAGVDATGMKAVCEDAAEGKQSNIVTAEEIKKVLRELLRFQETFVTPQDLLVNTMNLEDLGILTYTKDELIMHKEKEN